MVYAKSLKPGNYVGFFKDLNKSNTFHHMDFIAANALPGPQSQVRCSLQLQGLFGSTELLNYEKKSAISQIPGYRYQQGELIELPQPKQWYHRVMAGAILRSVEFRKLPGQVLKIAANHTLNLTARKSNPLWIRLREYLA